MVEFFVRFFNAIGRVVEVNTLVDFYNYVKAVEYLICVGFFVTFPLFYKHVIKPPGKTGEID
jgi:hypothetical protein